MRKKLQSAFPLSVTWQEISTIYLVFIIYQALCIHEVILLPQQSPVKGIALPFFRCGNWGLEAWLSSLTLCPTSRTCQTLNSHPSVPDSKACALCCRPSPLFWGAYLCLGIFVSFCSLTWFKNTTHNAIHRNQSRRAHKIWKYNLWQ